MGHHGLSSACHPIFIIWVGSLESGNTWGGQVDLNVSLWDGHRHWDACGWGVLRVITSVGRASWDRSARQAGPQGKASARTERLLSQRWA